MTGHGGGAPSAWVAAHAPLIRAGGSVLDLACGRGRHARWLAARWHAVLAVDRDAAALAELAGQMEQAGAASPGGVEILQADLEQGVWPLAGRRFDGIVVTNYLLLPLFPHLRAALAPGGVLIYETFAAGNERFGKPLNPDFLLRPGELLASLVGPGAQACAEDGAAASGKAAPEFRVLAYQHGQVEKPAPAMVQRICLLRTGE